MNPRNRCGKGEAGCGCIQSHVLSHESRPFLAATGDCGTVGVRNGLGDRMFGMRDLGGVVPRGPWMRIKLRLAHSFFVSIDPHLWASERRDPSTPLSPPDTQVDGPRTIRACFAAIIEHPGTGEWRKGRPAPDRGAGLKKGAWRLQRQLQSRRPTQRQRRSNRLHRWPGWASGTHGRSLGSRTLLAPGVPLQVALVRHNPTVSPFKGPDVHESYARKVVNIVYVWTSDGCNS